jgi:hypothetical protein
MKYAGQRLNAKRTERAVKRAQQAAARPKKQPKKLTKLDRLVLAKKQQERKTARMVLLNPTLPWLTQERIDQAKEFLTKHFPEDISKINWAKVPGAFDEGVACED